MDGLIGLLSSDKNSASLDCFSHKNPDQDFIEVKLLQNGHKILDQPSFRSNSTIGVKNNLDVHKSAFTTANETI